jgi:hypothetical protein
VDIVIGMTVTSEDIRKKYIFMRMNKWEGVKNEEGSKC